MPKWLKLIWAVLLLPVGAGALLALVRVVRATGPAETFWMALLGGMACWWAVYLLLPKPMLLYVFGHELTHALWTWLCGGKVQSFKVSARGGHVKISKSNFLIVLAPYFFPFYVALVLAVLALGQAIWQWSPPRVAVHWLVGAAYGFHVTLTLFVLRMRQSDIVSQGWFFSLVIIFLGNILVLLVGLPMLTPSATVLGSLAWWLEETSRILRWIARGGG